MHELWPRSPYFLANHCFVKARQSDATPELLPRIISLTVGLSVSDEACARLVQVLAALCTLEAGCVPLQVRGHSEDVLVVYLTSTAYTHGDSRLLCVRQDGMRSWNNRASLF